MKAIIVSTGMVIGGLSGMAMADCTTNPALTTAQLATAISGKLVCGRPAAGHPGGVSSPDRWQEEHIAGGVPGVIGGPLFDYKKGPGDPVDPRTQVGSWSVADGKITHSYIGGAVYTWEVHPMGGTRHSFCVGGVQHVASLIVTNTGTGCGVAFP
jgi:hypothetical protein